MFFVHDLSHFCVEYHCLFSTANLPNTYEIYESDCIPSSLNRSLLDPSYNDLFCNVVFKCLGSNKVFLILILIVIYG